MFLNFQLLVLVCRATFFFSLCFLPQVEWTPRYPDSKEGRVSLYEQSLEASGYGVHAANHTGVFPPQRQWDPFEVREAV